MLNSRLNNNGSPAAMLGGQQQAVTTAARALIIALRDALPHGRDYQTAPNGMAGYDIDKSIWATSMNAAKNIEDLALTNHLHILNQCEADRIHRESRRG